MSAIICFNVIPVSAQRQIDSVEYYYSGNDLILNITVTFQSDLVPAGVFNPLGYVDHLDLEIDGAYPYVVVNVGSIEKIHYSVEYNMGEVTGTPSVRARYVTNTNSEGDWTEPIVVPEFSLIHLAPILMVTTIAILLIKSKITAKPTK